MSDPASRHLRIFFGVLLGALALIGSANLILDPFRSFRVVDVQALRPYREKLVSRIAKGEMLVHDVCSTVILGTSRAEMGLDPEHPAWGAPACNLALTGLGAVEQSRVLARVAREPRVRELVIELAFFSFQEGSRPNEDFERSRFNDLLEPFGYHAALLFGEDGTRAALRVLSDYWSGRRAPYTERGFTDPARGNRRSGDRESFVWSLQRTVRELGEGGRGFRYAPQLVAPLVDGIRAARARGIAVTALILPEHAMRLELLHRMGQWPSYERWTGDLVRALEPAGEAALAPLWDFTSFDGTSAEAVPEQGTLRWHWDAAHLKRELGDEVIVQLRGAKRSETSAPGLQLTRANLAAFQEQLRAERETYVSSQREQLALLDEVLRRSSPETPVVAARAAEQVAQP